MAISEPVPLGVKRQISLAPYTTFKIGGLAEYFYEAESHADLKLVLAWAYRQHLPITVLGSGSNVLINDVGRDGLVMVIRTKGVTADIQADAVVVTAAAGESWDELVAHCVERGWWGVENLSAIPGTVGAFPIQNVGAYGIAAEDVVVSVTALHKETLTERSFSHQECDFTYRDSLFKHEEGKEYIVTAVTLRLSLRAMPRLEYKDLKEYFAHADGVPTLSSIREAVIAIRARKFPDLEKYGTAGSFFKNPIVSLATKHRIEAEHTGVVSYPVDETSVKLSAAWLIDNVLQMRGVRVGDVGTYHEQALVIVNYRNATATDIIAFAKKIEEQLFQKIKVTLEWEVQLF